MFENINVYYFMAYKYANGNFSLKSLGWREQIQIQCHLPLFLCLILLIYLFDHRLQALGYCV